MCTVEYLDFSSITTSCIGPAPCVHTRPMVTASWGEPDGTPYKLVR